MRLSDWSSDVCSSDLLPVENRMRINPKYVNLTFATLMSCVMSLIMTCFITALNTGLDANFFMRWAMAWSVAWPVAFLFNFLLAARLRRWVAARAIATDRKGVG